MEGKRTRGPHAWMEFIHLASCSVELLQVLSGFISEGTNLCTQSTPAPTLLSILTDAALEPGVDGRVLYIALAMQARLAGSIAPPITEDGSVVLVLKMIEKIFARGRQFTLVGLALKIVTSELLSQDILMGLNQYQNSRLNLLHNRNPVLAHQPLYPKKAARDVSYSVAEETLRAAIFIQDDLTRRKGERKPVLLVPGTAIPAGSMFQSNLGKLRKAIPEYRPSTRAVVTDLIAISPDFNGTLEITLVCAILSSVVCTPGIWQQAWHARFVRALRRVGGDSAYVPTTIVYSPYDQIVMSGKQASGIPQGSPVADVSNNHLQTIGRNRPGGGFYTHKGVLYSSLAWALIVDALQHDGLGDLARLNLTDVCGQWLPPQLGMEDVKSTEGLLLIAVAEVLKYKPKISQEPDIADYAM
ncbi:alpha/beta-hydrolase [Aspergillus uvarum CBS 121591]|uniref:Alpha/beta-hydrolase n=1 Tax=Aspergillus uvarum CBS 121591 TaxID=1448315 RepID=A0A319C4D3_9EURO|nr:alpha/beta-hydrolase [Aspergillus uvarum CBS 121591]PYH78877.1 alpha/beta-hydrolase [Aspergillus uvarum CBS 121591]